MRIKNNCLNHVPRNLHRKSNLGTHLYAEHALWRISFLSETFKLDLSTLRWGAMPWEYLRVVSLVVYISNSQCLTKNMRIRRGTEPGNPLLPGFFSSLPSAYVHKYSFIRRQPGGSQVERSHPQSTHSSPKF